MQEKKSPTLLVILDGFGYSTDHNANAIYQAQPEHLIEWFQEYPSTLLKAAGTSVGLLDHMIGNSEVGHLTIGSGRVIHQPVRILHDLIKKKKLCSIKVLHKALAALAASGKTLHLLGLLSDAGVHSHMLHILALIDCAAQAGVKKIIIHAFLDGRDVPPRSAKKYLKQLDDHLKKIGAGCIGSISGRFYAMDRDGNWSRTQKVYELLVSKAAAQDTWQMALRTQYTNKLTDEFIEPTTLKGFTQISDGDGIIFFNFREDRARQLTHALLDESFPHFKRKKIRLGFMITATQYYANSPALPLLPQVIVRQTLFDTLQKAGKTMFSIAETEKYAHITYFFNGGREIKREHETRVLIPSKSYESNYVHIPEMSAHEITEAVIYSLQHYPRDFYLINYANLDMVGHSGDLPATTKAVTYVDQQLKQLYDQVVIKMNGTLYITGDHGKAESLFDKTDHQARTAHTNNPVPFIMVSKKTKGVHKELPLHQLADIAPFILKQMGIAIPRFMRHRS